MNRMNIKLMCAILLGCCCWLGPAHAARVDTVNLLAADNAVPEQPPAGDGSKLTDTGSAEGGAAGPGRGDLVPDGHGTDDVGSVGSSTSSVPVPPALALLITGLAGLGLAGRRRR